MKKIDLLFVRACKSLNPERRVRSVYRRFYYRGPKNEETYHVSSLLVTINAQYDLVKLHDLISALHPRSIYQQSSPGDIPDYWQLVLNVMISTIRLSAIDKFDNYIPPKRFKD